MSVFIICTLHQILEIKGDWMSSACSMHGKVEACLSTGKKPLMRFGTRWEDNNKMVSSSSPVAGSCEQGDEALGSIKCRICFH
jgi:hypothetical protein